MSVRSPKARYGLDILRGYQENQASRLSVPKKTSEDAEDSPQKSKVNGNITPFLKSSFKKRNASLTVDISYFDRAGVETEMGMLSPHKSTP